MRVIVTGSRDWPTEQGDVIHQALGGVWLLARARGEQLTVVHGEAPTGADRIADHWASLNTTPWSGVIVERHPADWTTFGKRAGPIRNQEMAEAGAQLCLAFLYEPEGAVSKGTRDMIGHAEVEGIPVFMIHWRKETQ